MISSQMLGEVRTRPPGRQPKWQPSPSSQIDPSRRQSNKPPDQSIVPTLIDTQNRPTDPALFPRRFEDRLPRYEHHWSEEMSEHLPYDPPNFDGVIRIVRRHLRAAHLLGE